jgi:membrane associated rhomboid family serine protease
MFGLVAAFALQQYVIVYKGKNYETYLALQAYGMKSWHVWQLFTFQCMSSNVIHLLGNLALLWFLGRRLERGMGWKKFLLLLIGTGLAGGVLQGTLALVASFLPQALEQFWNPAAGSSAGLFGALAVYCLLQANPRFRLLLWVALGVSAIAAAIPFGQIPPSDPEQSIWKAIWWAPMNLAHAAHVGGMLAGMWFVKRGWQGSWTEGTAGKPVAKN